MARKRTPKVEQLELGIGEGTALQFDPVQVAAEGAKAYTRGRYQPPPETLQDNPRAAFAIQHEYRHRQGHTEERTRKAYEAMRRETADQYDFMTRPTDQGGLGIVHEVTQHDPYGGPEELAEDLRQGRIKTFSTKSTGGHTFFTDEENDKFRAVHDFFGHAAIGRGFSRHGEEAAYQSHVQMYSPAAREALASETRGQNTFLNYSPEGGFPDQSPGAALVGMSKFAQSPNISELQKKRERSSGEPKGTGVPGQMRLMGVQWDSLVSGRELP